MKIYHTPLLPYSDNDIGYRPTHEYCEGEADTLQDYIISLLPELNAGGGTWRLATAAEVKIYGQLPRPFIVLRGEYPGELPIMVAYYGK